MSAEPTGMTNQSFESPSLVAKGRALAPRGLALASLAAAALVGGCANWWVPGGPMASEDRYTYLSTEYMPQTVMVVDTVTQQIIWSKDVPVGKKLIMRFSEFDRHWDSAPPDERFPVRLQWDLIDADVDWASPKQESWVVKARRVDTKLRPVPERPPVAPKEEGPPPGTATTDKPPVIEKK